MSIFNSAPTFYKPKVNRFPLSQEVLTTGEMGKLYPVFTQFMLPNSYFKVSPTAVVKTAPMFAPIYSGVKVSFAAFAVPMRLLWSDWSKWYPDPENTKDLPPHISESTLWGAMTECLSVSHSLASDFDVPVIQMLNGHVAETGDPDKVFTIQDFLAYHRIWQDYFRNENLQNESQLLDDDTLQSYDTLINGSRDLMKEMFVSHRYVNYAKDYFTSALPTPQKGVQTFLSVLNSVEAPVRGLINADISFDFPADHVVGFESSNLQEYGTNSTLVKNWFEARRGVNSSNLPDGSISYGDKKYFDKLYADLSDAAAGISVSDFRALFAVQSFREQLMVGGSRGDEFILSFYGCRVPDYRANKPEFLGIDSLYVAPQEVVAHDANDLGNLGAYGQGLGSGRSFRYYASEHTVFMIVMYMKPKSLYLQGMPKTFRLDDMFKLPMQIFQHLGEEEVLNEELFYTGSSTDDQTFGYQSRYAYWRSKRDRIRGDFQQTLSTWHLARIFNALPSLNEEFIRVDPYANNIVAAGDELNRVFNYSGKAADHFWIDIYFNFDAKLPLKYHSKPMLVG